jgi:hypothetical protein
LFCTPFEGIDATTQHIATYACKLRDLPCSYSGIAMKPMRSNRQELETLDYLGDMLAELALMAQRDNHRLLGYILHTGMLEVEAQKRLRSTEPPSLEQGHDAA